MKSRDAARWLSDEHAAVHELSFKLRQQLAVPPAGARATWLPHLRGSFRQFSEHLKRHMQLEESGGYMREVVTRRPTLGKKIDALHHEHSELDRLISQIDAALTELSPEDSLLIRHCMARIGMLLSYVERHKEQEEHLVMYTFTEDLGVGD